MLKVEAVGGRVAIRLAYFKLGTKLTYAKDLASYLRVPIDDCNLDVSTPFQSIGSLGTL